MVGVQMATINTHATRHGGKSENYAGGVVIHYFVFPESNAAEGARLKKVEQACFILARLDKRLDLNGPCNSYFRKLPRSRSFNQIWRDPGVFVNYSPSGSFFGAAHSNGKDLCVTKWCIENHNRWVIAATIVHELAHLGGAPGGASHDAERSVEKCGFGPQYEPTIVGSIRGLAGYLERVA